MENNTDITVIVRKLQEFELLKKLILDKDQEVLFNKIPKPNLLEIVEEEEFFKSESKRSLEEELNPRRGGSNPYDRESIDVTERVKRAATQREFHKEAEEKQLQDIYDKLNKNREASELNNRLLGALEEYIVRQKIERQKEEFEADPSESNIPSLQESHQNKGNDML